MIGEKEQRDVVLELSDIEIDDRGTPLASRPQVPQTPTRGASGKVERRSGLLGEYGFTIDR